MLGVIVLLHAIAVSRALHDSWTLVWVTLGILWILLGLGILVVRAVRAVQGKLGAGALASVRPRAGDAPAPEKRE